MNIINAGCASVLHIVARKEVKVKSIKNNISAKLRQLVNFYPRLNFYGEEKDFTLLRLQGLATFYSLPLFLCLFAGIN
jgi:uncharacterized pyridoxamine 5'-phosphate oxidase family protein